MTTKPVLRLNRQIIASRATPLVRTGQRVPTVTGTHATDTVIIFW